MRYVDRAFVLRWPWNFCKKQDTLPKSLRHFGVSFLLVTSDGDDILARLKMLQVCRGQCSDD